MNPSAAETTATTHHPTALDWVPVPLEVVHLGRATVAVWCRLAAAGETLPDRPDLIRATVRLDDLDLAETTARRALTALETSGLLMVDRAPGKASTYTLIRSGRWARVPIEHVDLDPGALCALVVLDCAGPTDGM